MNHSCEPNTVSVVISTDEERVEYGMEALRRIKTGEVRNRSLVALSVDVCIKVEPINRTTHTGADL